MSKRSFQKIFARSFLMGICFAALFVLGVSVVGHVGYAQVKQIHYRNLFARWGIRADGLLDENAGKNKKLANFTQQEFLEFIDESLLDKPEEDLIKEIVYEGFEGVEKDESFIARLLKKKLKDLKDLNAPSLSLIVLTSQLDEPNVKFKDKISDYSSIIFICDTSFEYPDEFSCDYTSVQTSGDRVYKLKGLDFTEGNSRILDFFLDRKRVFVVPESYLVDSLYEEVLGNYFLAISRSDASGSLHGSSDLLEEDQYNSTIRQIKKVKNSSLFEMSVYVFSFLFIVLVSSWLLRPLVNTPERFIQKGTYTQILQRGWKFFLRIRWLSICLFVILLACYVPLVVAISIKDISTLDLNYIQSYILDTFKLGTLADLVEGGHTFRILFVIYNCTLFTLLAFILLPNLVNFVMSSLAFRKKINRKVSKSILFISILVFMGLAAFFDVDSVLNSATLVLLVFAYFLYMVTTQFGTISNLYTKRGKALMLFIGVFIVVAGCGYRYYRSTLPIKYEYEPLIGIKDKIVMFPYNKQHGDNVLFEDFFLKVDSPILADNYLIYHPKYSAIENLDVEDFKLEGNYMVLSGSEEDYLERILKSVDFRNLVSSYNRTPLFYIEDFVVNFDSKYTAQITFNCERSLGPQPLSLLWYSLTSVNRNREGDGTEIDEATTKLIFFPGCEAPAVSDTAPTHYVSYKVPLNVSRWDNGRLLFELSGDNLEDVVEHSFYKDGKKVNVNFVDPYVGGGVIEGSRPGGVRDQVVVYSPDAAKGGVRFENELGSEFNISGPLNTLMRKKLLRQPFILWTSSNKVVVIRD